ncbi:MAG: glycosyltransferase family 2 protein [Candidatus Omnitrophota bacterium]|jgi:dolichol-phosphate mannosyltransferase
MISIVIPTYNEKTNIKHVIGEIKSAVLDSGVKSYEIIVVDDHSSDGTFEAVDALKAGEVRCVRLSRQSGSHVALRAGIKKAKGEAVLCISADGQDDPACLKKMLEKRKAGAAVVWALRNNRKNEPWHNRKAAELFYKILFSLLSTKGTKIDLSRADFFLLDRIVVDAINSCVERNTSLFGLIAWLGFNQDSVEYERRRRLSGSSKWKFTSRFRLAKDWIIAFSGVPIKIASLFGMIMSVIGGLGAIYIVVDKLFFTYILAGWTTIVVLILMMSGIQLTILGVVGEYLWRNLDESRKRPLYFIEKSSSPEEGSK